MFWSRKDKIVKSTLGSFYACPIPPKPDFVIMLELLRDAEKHDNESGIEISHQILQVLKNKIDSYCAKKPVQ